MSHLILPPLKKQEQDQDQEEHSQPQPPSILLPISVEDVSADLVSLPITPRTSIKISKSYEEIKETLQPFDLVFFQGADFVSNSIRQLQKLNHTDGVFSHVGIVINSAVLPCIKNSRPGEWYIWESTMSGRWNDGIPDLETGEGYFGTQIRSLDTVVDVYSKNPQTEIAFARLLNNPVLQKLDEPDLIYAYRMEQLRKTLKDTYEQYNHRIYDANLVNLIATIVPFCRCFRNCTRNESFFCSELVSIIYKKIGIFPWYLNEEDITPETLLARRFIVKNYIRNEAKSSYSSAEFDAVLQYPAIYVEKS